MSGATLAELVGDYVDASEAWGMATDDDDPIAALKRAARSANALGAIHDAIPQYEAALALAEAVVAEAAASLEYENLATRANENSRARRRSELDAALDDYREARQEVAS